MYSVHCTMYCTWYKSQSPFLLRFGHGPILVQINLKHLSVEHHTTQRSKVPFLQSLVCLGHGCIRTLIRGHSTTTTLKSITITILYDFFYDQILIGSYKYNNQFTYYLNLQSNPSSDTSTPPQPQLLTTITHCNQFICKLFNRSEYKNLKSITVCKAFIYYQQVVRAYNSLYNIRIKLQINYCSCFDS